MTEVRQLPQLVMRRENLSDLDEIALPPGFELRGFRPGDGEEWESIVAKSFGWNRSFEERIASHPYFSPERVLFVCDGAGKPVATACAWQEPEWGEDCGYLHMVGVLPEFGGRGLGYAISLAALRQMRADGKRRAVLETDDFRIAAIKTYLKLRFRPDIREKALLARWREVYRSMNEVFVQESTTPGNPGGRNEDALVANARRRIYAVIDGVSAIDGNPGDNGITGGYIAAQLLAAEWSSSARDRSLEEAVLKANSRLLGMMEDAGIDVSRKEARWGAVFAAVRVHDANLEFVQCGDCMLFARYRDGSVRAITRNQVTEFDRLTLDAKRELAGSDGLTEEEKRRRMRALFEANRNKANTADGYAVMNGDPALAYYMESGQISRARLAKIYLVTDGMFHFIENEKDPAVWESFLDELDEEGIESFMDRLTEREERDPLGLAYPRHKKSDDKSAVILEFP